MLLLIDCKYKLINKVPAPLPTSNGVKKAPKEMAHTEQEMMDLMIEENVGFLNNVADEPSIPKARNIFFKQSKQIICRSHIRLRALFTYMHKLTFNTL